MVCSHCKKEEETVTIGGKTFCAKCSTLIVEDKAVEEPKVRVPKMSFDENEIRTVKPKKEEISENEVAKAKEILKNSPLPAGNLDELEGSAILLDILEDNAKEDLDEKTVEEDKKLFTASEKVINAFSQTKQQETKKTPPKLANNLSTIQVMNDIKPSITKREDHLAKKGKKPIEKIEDSVKKEVEALEAPLVTQAGFTKEFDLIIISFVTTAIILVLLALFLAFR